MNKNKAVVLAKIETVYGTDPTPTGVANAILCEGPEISVIAKSLERNNVKPVFGAKEKLNIGEGLKLTFSTELRGGGAALPSTPPPIGPLFRGAGFTETIVATPGAECTKYTPHSLTDTAESLTLYFYMDGVLHKLLGARGTGPELDIKVNEYGKLKWEFSGLYAGIVDAALVTPTFNATKPPPFRAAAFTIDTYAAIIETLKISCKGEVAKRPDANAATGILAYFIKERTVTGEIDPEMVLKATKDFWGLWEASSQAAFTATVGSVASNRCVISAPAVEFDEPKYGDRENRLTLAMPLRFVPTSSTPEIEFKFN